MTELIFHWLQDACEHRFGYLRLAGALSALVLIPLCVAQMINVDPATLYHEGGVTETLSLIIWIGAVLLCLRALFRWHTHFDRLIFKWLCLICCLAAAREMDAQIWLNPDYIGQYGVHYRTDWFFTNKFGVSILLRLIWGAIFIAAFVFFFGPLFTVRRSIMRFIRNGDTATGLFLLGIAALAIGFINDDILRNTPLMSMNLREAIEETFELLGAIFFFAGIACFLLKPPSEHTGAFDGDNETGIFAAGVSETDLP